MTILAKACLPACDRFDHRDAMLARLRLQVALEQYRRAHGEPPSELTELAPQFIQDTPVDPFTGEPFHYGPSDSGYRLYSQAETEGGAVWRGQDPPTYLWSVAQR